MPLHAFLFNTLYCVWYIQLLFEWKDQHLCKQVKNVCVQFVQLNIKCMKMELCVQAGLWIQVYNTSFRKWWLKANLWKGHLMRGWGFIMSTLGWNFINPEFPWSGSTQLHEQPELITLPKVQKAPLFPSTLVLCQQLREGCVVWYDLSTIGLRTLPLSPLMCPHILWCCTNTRLFLWNFRL